MVLTQKFAIVCYYNILRHNKHTLFNKLIIT